ncbi:enoyl-(Acyl carrier protein) reductase domain-containing protein [Ditylenchus destructor]|nr:enoyl-(Acyl carrier protein) reductase domain-containing protein [Ditylenchus destructor]
MGEFSGKAVIVTGSSRGIGREVALAFGREGAFLTVHGQSKEKLDETVELLRKSGVEEKRIVTVLGPIQDENTTKAIVDETVKKFGKIDVNNAGVGQLAGADPASLENYDYVFSVNVRSVLHLTNLAAPHLSKTKGSVVNVSSICSMITAPVWAHYCMSKAALDHYTRNAAVSLGEQGIRVNSVNPGWTKTDIRSRHGLDEDKIQEAVTGKIILGRFGEASEIADAILFVASSKASYITGTTIVVDGGALDISVNLIESGKLETRLFFLLLTLTQVGHELEMKRTDKSPNHQKLHYKGSSRGIGREVALAFGREGALVTVHGQSKDKLDETVELLKKSGVEEKRIVTVLGPIQDENTTKAIVDETVKKFGRIDVLINNAGVGMLEGEAHDSLKNYDYVFSVNVRSVLHLTNLAAPHLAKTKGNVVNISSIGSMSTAPGVFMHYVMSKAALDHYSRNVANTLGEQGIRVNVINPGWTKSDFRSRHGLEEDKIQEAVTGKIILGRFGEASEISDAILFVASSKASYITGTTIVVDGGLLAHP